MKSVAIIAAACLGLLSCAGDKPSDNKTTDKPVEKTSAPRDGAPEKPLAVPKDKPGVEKKPEDKVATAPAATANNAAVDVDCDKLVPASVATDVCGVKEPMKATPQEGNRPIVCQRSTSADRTTLVFASVLDYGEEKYAREIAGDPAPGESTAKSKRGEVTKALNTSATMYRGRYVLGATAATMNDDTPVCTPEQLDTIVKGMHARFPGK